MTMTIRTCRALALLLLLAACNGEGEVPAKKGTSTHDLFLEFQVWGDEQREHVNVLLQLRQKNNRGQTVRLDPPGLVKLDDEVLQPDSSRMTGIFYETQKPMEAFAGHHKITVVDERKQQVSEEFDYTPFRLVAPMEGRVGRDDLILKLSGLKPGEKIRVTLIDTVFRTQDINELMPVVGGRIHITREQLRAVKTGPVTLLLFKELERYLENSDLRGGRMAVTYGLMREFELAE